MFVTLSRLGSLLVEVAEPLFGDSPAKSTVDKTVKEVEGQVAPKQAQSPVEATDVDVAAVVSTGHVVRMNASPPLRWEEASTAWICTAPTGVEVSFGDGERQSYRYNEGTAIRVVAGMIHFPRCDDRPDDT